MSLLALPNMGIYGTRQHGQSIIESTVDSFELNDGEYFEITLPEEVDKFSMVVVLQGGLWYYRNENTSMTRAGNGGSLFWANDIPVVSEKMRVRFYILHNDYVFLSWIQIHSAGSNAGFKYLDVLESFQDPGIGPSGFVHSTDSPVTFTLNRGGEGGTNTIAGRQYKSGAGGAGGYLGAGGNGGSPGNPGLSATNGGGAGGGGGGSSQFTTLAGDGGGVGIFGIGADGLGGPANSEFPNGSPGSGGTLRKYGGGLGVRNGVYPGEANAVVRLMWGIGRSFPYNAKALPGETTVIPVKL